MWAVMTLQHIQIPKYTLWNMQLRDSTVQATIPLLVVQTGIWTRAAEERRPARYCYPLAVFSLNPLTMTAVTDVLTLPNSPMGDLRVLERLTKGSVNCRPMQTKVTLVFTSRIMHRPRPVLKSADQDDERTACEHDLGFDFFRSRKVQKFIGQNFDSLE
jgi:hypothetical protein